MAQMVDIQGQRFGKLVAIERLPMDQSSAYKAVRWKCQCDCGNTANVLGVNLRKKINPTRSCGCISVNPDSIKGKKLGSLTVIEQVPMPEEELRLSYLASTFWKCQCECGNIIVLPRVMMQEKSLSCKWHCGCLKKIEDNYKGLKEEKILELISIEERKMISELEKQSYGEIEIGKRIGMSPHLVRRFLNIIYGRTKNGKKKI